MFEDASRRRFDVLLFWALDRLSREGVLETLQHLNRLTSYGVAWRSFTEQFFDSCGPFRDAVIAIMATLAKQERVKRSERTKAGLARARAAGKALGRPAGLNRQHQERDQRGRRQPARETHGGLSCKARELQSSMWRDSKYLATVSKRTLQEESPRICSWCMFQQGGMHRLVPTRYKASQPPKTRET